MAAKDQEGSAGWSFLVSPSGKPFAAKFKELAEGEYAISVWPLAAASDTDLVQQRFEDTSRKFQELVPRAKTIADAEILAGTAFDSWF